MKSIKRITAMITMIIMCLGLCSIGVNAYETWIDNGAICLTSVTDTEGNELTSVPAGSEITLQTKVKAGKEALTGQTAQLIIAAYANGFLCDEGKSEQVELKAVPQIIKASLNVPKNADALKVFVWDGRSSRKPIAESGVIGNEKTIEVSEILIDGESINEFSPEIYEYDITLNAAYLNYPEIVVKTNDILAKTEIICDGEFPAEEVSVTARVIKNNETAASYRINFRQEAPEITDIAYQRWVDDSKKATEWVELTDTVLLEEPDEYVNGLTKDHMRYSTLSDIVSENLYNPSNLPDDMITPFTDRSNFTLYDISPELLGGILIKNPLSEKLIVDGTGAAEGKTGVKFTINRSASIYVWASGLTGKQMSNDGYALVNGSPSYYYIGDPAAQSQTKGGSMLAWRLQVDTKSQAFSKVGLCNWYKKDVTVDPSKGYMDIEVPALGARQYIVVKFNDTPLMQNTAYYDANGDRISTGVIRDVFEPIRLDAEKTGVEKTLNNTVSMPAPFTDRSYYGIAEVGEELIGSELMKITWNAKGAGKPAETISGLEFELTHSAKVYFINQLGGLTDEWLAENKPEWVKAGFKATDDLGVSLEGGGASFIAFSDNNAIVNEYKVLPGETVKVSMDGLESLRGRILVFAKRCELE